MPWYHIVAPALLAAVLMVLDARRPGSVYWAYSQLLPGVVQLPPYADSSVYSDVFKSSAFRSEVVRRFVWGSIPGAYLAAAVNGSTLWDAIAGGLLVGAFALWPVFFHGLPLVNSLFWLLALYSAIALALVGMSVIGFAVVASFKNTFVEQAGSYLLFAILILLAGGVIRIAWSRVQPVIPWTADAPRRE